MSVQILTATDIGSPAGPLPGESRAAGEFSRMLNDELSIDQTPAGEALAVQVEEAVELFDPTQLDPSQLDGTDDSAVQVEVDVALFDELALDASTDPVADGELAGVVSTLVSDASADDPSVDDGSDDEISVMGMLMAAAGDASSDDLADSAVTGEVAAADSVAADVLEGTDATDAALAVGEAGEAPSTSSDTATIDGQATADVIDGDPVDAGHVADVASESNEMTTDGTTSSPTTHSEADENVASGTTTSADTSNTSGDDAELPAAPDAASTAAETSSDAGSEPADSTMVHSATEVADGGGDAAPTPPTGPSVTSVGSTNGTSAPAPAAPGAPMAPGVATGADAMVETTLSRIAETIEAMSAQPPPRSISLDLTELHGIRIRISIDGSEVSVDVSDTGAGSSGSNQWQRQLQDSLEDRRRAPRPPQPEATGVPAMTDPPTHQAAERGLRL